MSVEVRVAKSIEMEKNAATVGRMTGGMGFTGDMTKINWKAVRRICNIGYSLMPKEKKIKIRKLDLDGVYGEMSIPRKQTSDNIIMYIHGGGLVSGSAKATRAYCSMLAKYSGCRVISIDYALAPEHPWPAGVDSCYTAYKAIRKQYPRAKLALTGESAGGNLSLTTTIRLIQNGEQVPECLVPHSPVCDFVGILDRSYYVVKDDTVSVNGLESLVKLYCPGSDRENPEISPIYFDKFDKFPPTTITCDFNETLRADCDALYKKLEEAGVEAHLIIYKNTFHAFAPIGTSSPETMRLMIENISFMKKCWGEE